MSNQRWNPTDEQTAALSDVARTHTELAAEYGVSEATIRRAREARRLGRKEAARVLDAPPHGGGPLGTPGVTKDADGVTTATSKPLQGVVDAEAYLRERWNFPADRWHCMSAIGNEWQGGDGEGGTTTYCQVKGSFRPIADIRAIVPEAASWTGPRFPLGARGAYGPAGLCQIVVVGDDQAPYQDEALHAATCAMLRDIQPAKVAHIGDLCDYTNISKHKDHAVTKAEVDDCTQAGVDILVAMREAAPDAEFQILAGNHDIRPLAELLLRAERMANIHCARLPGETERERVLDLRKLWRLDDLGIEYVEDDRGWEHAEIDLIPGPRGLAAVHGNLTGRNVAMRTLEKVGRSVIMGHTHQPESVYSWNRTIGFEMRAMVIGAQCEVRGGGGKSFPTFAARDGWAQGGALVTVHPDGEWHAERMRWTGDALLVGRDRYTP